MVRNPLSVLFQVGMLPLVGLLSDLIFSPMHRLAHHPKLYKYNHKVHHGTGHAPVELHLGIDPRHPGILAPPGQEAAPLNYADMDEYNKQQAHQIAEWVRGKLMIRRAEQAREVARYYQHKNMSLKPGS